MGRLADDVAPDRCCGVRRFYVMSPKHCHAFVGYLEEEAVKTCAPLRSNPSRLKYVAVGVVDVRLLIITLMDHDHVASCTEPRRHHFD